MGTFCVLKRAQRCYAIFSGVTKYRALLGTFLKLEQKKDLIYRKQSVLVSYSYWPLKVLQDLGLVEPQETEP